MTKHLHVSFHKLWIIFVQALLVLTFASAAHAQPTLSKVFTPSTIGPGSVSTITFTITNSTGTTVTGLAFTDVLPTVPGDVDIADPANASTDCLDGVVTALDGGGTIGFANGRLGAGQSCTVTVDVTAGTAGVHTNPAVMLTFNELAGDPPASLPVDLTVVTTRPGFTKSFLPSSISLGSRSTLTLTINNTANASNVPNLDFTDTLPTGMVIADPANASTTCGTATLPPTLTAAAGTSVIILDANGTSSFPAVAAGATCTVTVDVTATAAGMLDNISGELLASFVSAGKASATLDVTVTPIALSKSFTDDPVPPGGTVTLEFTINNFNRMDSATGVAFTDDLTTALAGLTFSSLLSNSCGGSVSGDGTTMITFSGGTVAQESSCTIRVSLTVPAGATPGTSTNTTGAITATIGGSPVTGNAASELLSVQPAPVLTKEFLEVGTLTSDPVVAPGDDVVIRFTVTNTSTTSMATAITFDDELTDGGPGTGFLPFPITVVTPTLPTAACGGTLAFFSPDTDRQGLRLTGGSLAASPSPPAALTSCTFDVTLTIPATFPAGTYTNTTEEITATVDGATRTGNVASDTLDVIAAPTLSKSFTDDPVAPGGTVTLEFTLTHSPNSPTDATGIVFTDDLAAALTGLTATGLPLSNICGAGSSLTGSMGDTFLTFAGGSLSPGASCTFSVTLDVPAGAAAGTFTNTTSGVSATVMGGTRTSAAASDILDVAGLVFTKEFVGDPVIAGDTVTLRFTIQNVHPTDDATITFFTDNLAAALPSLAATGGPSVDTCGGSLSGTTFLVYTGGSVMSGTSCIIEVEVLVPAAAPDGTFTNTTSSLSATQGGAVAINPAIDNLVVNSNVLQLTKLFTDDPVSPGGAVTLEFTLTNLDTTQAASGVGFSDDLGAALTGLTFDSVLLDTCMGTVSGTGTTMITVSGVSLTAGGMCTIRVSLTVPAGAAANNYTNTTSAVSGTIGGLAVSGDAVSDVLQVIQLLSFSKSFDGPTTATGTAKLTFTITNPGSNTAIGISFIDNLDAVITGLIATSLPAVPCGVGSSITGVGSLAFTGGELPPSGGMCSFAVDVLAPATATAGTFPNTTSDLSQAGLKVADPATANLVIEPPPTFAKVFMADAIFAGSTSTLKFTINNTASALAASSLAFTDTLPAGVVVATPSVTLNGCGGTLSATAGASVISLTGGSVAAGSTCSIDVDVTSSTTGAHVNTSGDLTSSSGNSGTASDTLSVSAAAGLSVTKSDGVSTATPGGSLTYTIVAANAGPSTDPALVLTDTFPSPPLTCTYTSVASGGATGNTAAGSGDLAETLSMPAGSLVTYTVSCTIASNATGTLSNTVSITPSITDTTTGDNSATDSDTVLAPSADLAITKSDGVTTAVPGQTTLIYTIVASNGGLSDDPSVSVTDTFPTDLTCTYTSVAAGGATGNTSGSGNLSDTLNLPSGSSVTYTVSCTIDSSATGTLSNTATVTASVTDPTAGNNSATDGDTLLAPETDLLLAKDDGVLAVAPGGSLTYSLTVTNNGPSDSTGGTISDTLPTGLSFVSSASGCTEAGGTVTCPVPALANGANTVLTFVVSVSASQTAEFTNTATVTATETDPTAGNNSASHLTQLLVGFSKVFTPDSITLGGTSTLIFTIDNTSNMLAASSLAFTDSLPSGVEVASPNNAVSGCGGTFTAAAGSSTITFTGGTVAAGVSCTLSVDVTSSTAGMHVNTTSTLTSSLGTGGTATDTLTVNAPEMDAQGLGISIPNGDTTPNLSDDTEFGSTAVTGGTVVKTYTIVNTGDGDLTLSGAPLVALMGTHPGDFSLTTPPTTPVTSGGGTTTFSVTFDPTLPGVRRATVSIANNDTDENPYTFDIGGIGDAVDMFGHSFLDENANQGKANAVLAKVGTSCPFNFSDISGTGTVVATGDAGQATVTLGGPPFSFYGVPQTQLEAHTDGFLSTDIGTVAADPSNDCPIPAAPSNGSGNRLYALHDDLTTTIYHQYFSTCPRVHDEPSFSPRGCNIFQWDGTYTSGGGNVSVQAILYDEVAEIVYQMQTVDQTGQSSTTAIQQTTPSLDGLQYTCNTPGALTSGVSAICYFSPSAVPVELQTFTIE